MASDLTQPESEHSPSGQGSGEVDDKEAAEHSTPGQGSEEVDEKEAAEPNPATMDMVICSFALHLLEDSSQLWALLSGLSWKSTWLIVLEPHKKPDVSCSPAIAFDSYPERTWKPLDQGGLGLDAMEFPRMEG